MRRPANVNQLEPAVAHARKTATTQRVVSAGLVGLSVIYLMAFVPRGWVPHDEGMIGQAAERVLNGALPHVDYQDPYTGGLTWLHAAVFKLAGVDLIYPRWMLLAGAAFAQVLTFLILRRYLAPIGAALAAWVALGWSFPNYFASLPSWWVLICALACLWAFIRYVETGLLPYAAAAGLAAGISILMKQTGLYVLVALVMAILYGGGHRDSKTRAWWPGRVLNAAVAIAALGLALTLLAARLALSDLIYLLLPIAACSRILVTANGHATDAQRNGFLALLIALGSAAVPLLFFVAPYLVDGIGALVQGLFVLPQKRVQFASFDMPPAYWIFAGAPLVAMLMPAPFRAPASAGRRLGIAFGIAGAALVTASLTNAAAYQVTWQSVRGAAALLPIAVCWLLLSRIRDAQQRWILFGCAAMLAWASMVQIPFSAPIYFCYVTPLAVITAVALASASNALHRPMVLASGAVLLLFALSIMNRGYIYNLGFLHQPSALNVPLDLGRAHLTASAADGAAYRRVLDLIAAHIGDGQLVAGPDCPEVYFLTGRVSAAGTLYDFFGDHVSPEGWVNDLPGWRTASVVVLNHQRRFSFGPSADLIAQVRKEFPKAEAAGTLEVRWR
jgi:hypothetical protein